MLRAAEQVPAFEVVDAGPKPGRTLISREVRLIWNGFEGMRQLVKQARAEARRHHRPPPEYPKETDEVRALLARLAGPR